MKPCEEPGCSIVDPEPGVTYCQTHSTLRVGKSFVQRCCPLAEARGNESLAIAASVSAALSAFRVCFPGCTVRAVVYDMEG